MADLTRNSRTILKLEKVQYNTPMTAGRFHAAGAAAGVGMTAARSLPPRSGALTRGHADPRLTPWANIWRPFGTRF